MTFLGQNHNCSGRLDENSACLIHSSRNRDYKCGSDYAINLTILFFQFSFQILNGCVIKFIENLLLLSSLKMHHFQPPRTSPLAATVPELLQQSLVLSDGVRDTSGTDDPGELSFSSVSDSTKDNNSNNLPLPPDLLHRMKAFPLFQLAPASFFAALARSLRLVQYRPQEYIVKQGEPSRAMYWILRGSVGVTSADGESVYAELNAGSFFGEIGILFNRPRTATVVARTKVLLGVLTKDNFSIVLEQYPQFERLIRDEGQERLAMQEKRKRLSRINIPSIAQRGSVAAPPLPFKYSALYANTNSQSLLANEHDLLPGPALPPATALHAATGDFQAVDTIDNSISAREFLCSLNIFKCLPNNVLHDLALAVEVRRYLPIESVFNEGDMGRDIFFIVHGEVEVIKSHAVVARLGSMSYFGEFTFLASLEDIESPRSASIRTISDCEMLVVHGSTLDNLCHKYPAVRENMKRTASERNKFNRDAFVESWQGQDGYGDVTLDDIPTQQQPQQQESQQLPPSLDPDTCVSFKNVLSVPAPNASVTGLIPIPTPESPGPYDSLPSSVMSSKRRKLTENTDSRVSQPTASTSFSTTLFKEPFGSAQQSNVPSTILQPVVGVSFKNFAFSSSPATIVNQQKPPTPASGANTPSISAVGLNVGMRRSPSPQDPTAKTSPLPQMYTPPKMNPSLGSLHKFSSINRASFQYAPHDFRMRLNSINNGRRRSSYFNVGPLPDSLLLKVFQYCDLQSLVKVAQVCSRWKQLVYLSDSLMTNLDLTPWCKELDDETLIQITNFVGSRPQKIILTNCYHITDVGFSYLINEVGFSGCIKELIMKNNWNISAMAIMDLSVAARQLTNLDLSNCRKVKDDVIFRLIGNDKFGCPNLQNLNLGYCKYLTDESMKYIGEHAFDRLKSLDLTRCTTITDQGFLSWLSATDCMLERLILRDCTFLSDKVVEVLGLVCTNLKELDCTFCCMLTDVSLKLIGEGLPKLNKLNLSFCGSAVSDYSLYELTNLAHLNEISIKGCIRVTRAGVDMLLTKMKSLGKLVITQCSRVNIYHGQKVEPFEAANGKYCSLKIKPHGRIVKVFI